MKRLCFASMTIRQGNQLTLWVFVGGVSLAPVIPFVQLFTTYKLTIVLWETINIMTHLFRGW
jgi:hypothetical protein